MHRGVTRIAFVCLIAMQTARAQEIRVWNRIVQVHGFFTQGFVYTDQNNWLTMNTSAGSGAMTDMGLNVSSRFTEKLRVGAQVYDRNLGKLGRWHPSLDWAVVDCRFANWLGVRGGKVKTTFGLYNDSQDLDFMYSLCCPRVSTQPTFVTQQLPIPAEIFTARSPFHVALAICRIRSMPGIAATVCTADTHT